MRARTALLGPLAVLAALDCGVAERSLGEACLKDEDCLSGVCADRACVAAPPLLDGETPGDTGAGDAPTDAPADTAAPPPDAGAIDSPPPDAAGGSDAPADTPAPTDAKGA